MYDPIFPPDEIARDPSSWMLAPEMEAYLETLSRMHWGKLDGSLMSEAGHAVPRNRAWGVLDSVLRMMPQPQEAFQQPARFLSYFISPEPPIENLQRTENTLSFDLPLPAQQYPHVADFLKAAFESLPLYVGQGRALCEWNDIHLKITWPEAQESFFAQDPGRQISPDLLQSMVSDHQKLLRELSDKNMELQRKDEELLLLRQSPQSTPAPAGAEAALGHLSQDQMAPGYVIAQNLARLHDYMVRAQQLMTMFAGLAKKEPAVKEALRRLDWDHVKSQYPRVIADSVESLRRMQNKIPTSTPTSTVSRPEELPHV